MTLLSPAMPRDRDPVDVIEDQLRAVAAELGERRIREIATEVRQDIEGRELYTRKGSSEARHATEARWQIARALDLTGQRIKQLAKLGMPLDSVEAAVAWRKQHVPRGRVARYFPLD